MRIFRFTLILMLLLAVLGAAVVAAAWFYIVPGLPNVETLREVQYQVPLRIYTREGRLIAEFGEKRRDPIVVEELPDLMIKAFLAAEDDRFYEHPGVDYRGLMRAGIELIRTGKKTQGGSTITMQVARNFFLSREKTYLRKVNEIFLALRIEQALSKDKILELYLNKIYLGNRSYGVAAASRVYYGVGPRELTVAQIAMIAGLPKAPSRYNPLSGPERAMLRRNYVLRRMRELDNIDEATYQNALAAPLTARRYIAVAEVKAPYIAEMVRAELVQRYGEDAYTAGLRVYTTVVGALQPVANDAVEFGLAEYEERHGYRGPEQRDIDTTGVIGWPAELQGVTGKGIFLPGLVQSVAEDSAQVLLKDGQRITLPWEEMSWARPFLSTDRRGPRPKKPADVVQPGDLIRVRLVTGDKWRLAQLPSVQAALVALAPDSGAVRALVGGFDFYNSKFNRVVQARRQPGSGFKPFIYSSALEAGYTAASMINDAPVVFDDPGLEAAWRPENYSGKFFGPTRLRIALAKSRNLVSIRLLRAVGIRYATDYLVQLGFDRSRLPQNLSLVLGTATLTPLEMAGAYSVFSNGGYRVEPYFIERIEDRDHEVIFQAQPARVCRFCLQATDELSPEPSLSPYQAGPPPPRLAARVMKADNHYIMYSILRDVVRIGTAKRARSLGRNDLAGKTGTTNDQRDAWFFGFIPGHIAVAWVGADDNHPLGNQETGGRAALPIWKKYMQTALDGVPEQSFPQPADLVSVRIDPETGLRARAGTKAAVFEMFRADHVPAEATAISVDQTGLEGVDEGDSLF